MSHPPFLRRSPRIAALVAKQAPPPEVVVVNHYAKLDVLIHAANCINVIEVHEYFDTLPDDSRNRMRVLLHDMTLMEQPSWQINLGSEPAGFLTDLRDMTSILYPSLHVQARMVYDGRYIVSVS